jgi:hypothetical protein
MEYCQPVGIGHRKTSHLLQKDGSGDGDVRLRAKIAIVGEDVSLRAAFKDTERCVDVNRIGLQVKKARSDFFHELWAVCE